MMPLLNYSSKVNADRTVGEIQKILSQRAKATAIMHQYDNNGYIIALNFQIATSHGPLAFKLPTDWRPVLSILEKDAKVPRSLRTQEQALRVAWRIVKDWVEAQVALIETSMVEPEQVFLPYMVGNNGQTVYETFEHNPQHLLGSSYDQNNNT